MQLIGFVLVVGLSALSWLFQKVAEQREKKRRVDLAEKRTLETLRTGREPTEGEVPPSVTSRQQELAAKRQAQLEELRRRQQERARQQTQPRPSATVELPRPRAPQPAPGPTRPPRAQPPIVFIPGSSGPIVVTPRKPARPGPQARTPARPPAQQVPRAGKRPAAAPRQRPSQRIAPAQPQERPAASASTSHGLLSDINTQAPTAPVDLPTGQNMERGENIPRTPGEWRRALVMREVLSKPLALRAPGEDVLG